MNSERQRKSSDDENQLNTTQAEPLELDDQYIVPQKLSWGRCKPFLFRNGRPSIIIGPHWPLFICAFLSFLILNIVLIVYRLNGNVWILYATLIINLNQCLSFLIVALINPGIANVETISNDHENQVSEVGQKNWYCKKCKLIQQKETSHCFDCDICILQYDHHCPWTGKCVGRDNIKYFYYFILSTIVFMIFNLIVTLYKAKIIDQQKE